MTLDDSGINAPFSLVTKIQSHQRSPQPTTSSPLEAKLWKHHQWSCWKGRLPMKSSVSPRILGQGVQTVSNLYFCSNVLHAWDIQALKLKWSQGKHCIKNKLCNLWSLQNISTSWTLHDSMLHFILLGLENNFTMASWWWWKFCQRRLIYWNLYTSPSALSLQPVPKMCFPQPKAEIYF